MNQIVILMYHIIDKPKAECETKYCCLPDEFNKHMRFLASSNYALLNLNDVISVLKGNKKLSSDAIVVTFDDGFNDFYYNALPVLEYYKIPATLFMVSNRIDQYNDWMVEKGSPKRELLSANQLNKIKNVGITIGSHTRSHPKLNEISNNSLILRQEIEKSKQELEDLLNIKIDHFAYPYGLFDDASIAMVKESGYLTACSTRSGFNRLEIDPYLLRRIEVFGSDSMWHFKKKIQFGTNDMSVLFLVNYYLSRFKSKFITTG